MELPQRRWGSWIQSAQGEEGWTPCPENPQQQVKFAQRSVGVTSSLVRLQLSLKLRSSLAQTFFALPEALGDGTVADPSQIFVARPAAVPRNGAVTVELRVDKEKLWFQESKDRSLDGKAEVLRAPKAKPETAWPPEVRSRSIPLHPLVPMEPVAGDAADESQLESPNSVAGCKEYLTRLSGFRKEVAHEPVVISTVVEVLAAHLPEADRLLEPHLGRWLVRRAFPEATCSTQVFTSEMSIYLDCAQVASPHPSDESQMLVTFLRLVPVTPLQFRMRHLLRASLSRCLQPWFAWLFSDSQVAARAETFYVILSIENCFNGPPLLPQSLAPRPFSLEDWQQTDDDSFAAYLRHFTAAAGLGDVDVLGSLDGKQLALHQAAMSRESWMSIAPRFLPMFENASIAYRRMAFYKLGLAERLLQARPSAGNLQFPWFEHAKPGRLLPKPHGWKLPDSTAPGPLTGKQDCNNHNYADKINCNRCGAPRPPDMSLPQPPSHGGKGGGKVKDMRPGDWMCPSCGNHNYADKKNCNRCGLARPLDMTGGAPVTRAGYGAATAPPVQRASPYGFNGKIPKQQWQAMVQNAYADAPVATPGPGGKGVGGWVCPACGNYNYPHRSNCNRCGVPKETRISKAGLREGDWICMACGNHNYADKIQCNKCGMPKEHSVAAPAKGIGKQEFREGDWQCPACGNHNYASRTACNKCGLAKPSDL
eukprot:s882_g4.t3